MLWWKTKRLKARDPEVRRRAVASLEAEAGAEAEHLLLEALADEDEQVRAAAAMILGGRPAEEVFAKLISGLNEPRPHVPEGAAAALGYLGEPNAIAPLVSVLGGPNPTLRSAAASALRKLGWKPGNGEEQSRLELAAGNACSVALVGGTVTALVKELKHDTAFVRRAVAEALENINDSRTIKPLLAAMADDDPTVRVSVIHALSKGLNQSVTDTLLKRLILDEDARVRLAAAQVLARSRDPELVPAFLNLLADSSFEIRLAAVTYLGHFRDPQNLAALLPMLSDPDADVRQAAAIAVGELANPEAIPALVLAFADEDCGVRQAVESALEKIDCDWAHSPPAQQACAQLEARLVRQPAWVRAAASVVIARIRGTDSVAADSGLLTAMIKMPPQPGSADLCS